MLVPTACYGTDKTSIPIATVQGVRMMLYDHGSPLDPFNTAVQIAVNWSRTSPELVPLQASRHRVIFA